MPKKINQEFPIQLPVNIYEAFSGLDERGLMTPTHLSSLVISAVLPAKSIVEKKKPLVNDEQGLCTVRSLYERANYKEDRFKQFKTIFYAKIAEIHTLASLSVDGLETFEAKQNQPNPNQQYEILK